MSDWTCSSRPGPHQRMLMKEIPPDLTKALEIISMYMYIHIYVHIYSLIS